MAAGRRGEWRVTHLVGPAGELLALPPEWKGREVRICNPERPALVLGSHQTLSGFDTVAVERAGLEVARRSSGGGAVLVGPGTVAWADFVLPVGDPLWDDDVGRAGWWLGGLWAEAVAAACGLGPPDVWQGPMVNRPLSRLVCFAGLGPGEVTLGGAKVVGISQRRTRAGVLFQTAAMLEWDPAAYLSLLADPLPQSRRSLQTAAAGLGAGSEASLRSALLRLLMP
jgi:lipoate-protein ligase A